MEVVTHQTFTNTGGYGQHPGSGRLSQTGSPPNRLTPMPEYMRPVTKSASRRWKKLHEDHMMTKLIDRRNLKKEQNKKTKEQAVKLVRKIPVDILAKTWMKENTDTADTRAFLVDKVLPTLILGLEKLLTEVDKLGLSEQKDIHPNFNPVNFLAQYLMRNNPRYSNFSEASPYIRGLREVGDQLKQQLCEMDENRLVRIKLEARKRREGREQTYREVLAEKQRRERALRGQFREWSVPGTFPEGRVDLALIQNALRSFEELVENFPSELQAAAKFKEELDPTDDTGKSLLQHTFFTYLLPYTEDMSSWAFDQFMLHISRCAQTHRAHLERDQRKTILAQLFSSCDHAGVRVLDRHRILNLLEMFYDKTQDDVHQNLRNPRKWPMVELHEEMSDDDEAPEEKPADSDTKDEVIENPSDQTDQPDTPNSPAQEQTDRQSSPAQEQTDRQPSPAQQQADRQPSPVEQQADGDVDEGAAPSVVVSGAEDPDVSAEEHQGVEHQDSQDPSQEPVEAVDHQSQADNAEELNNDLEDHAEERPPMTQQSKVSFADGTAFNREATLLTSHESRSHSQASCFDENLQNMSQFVQGIETFLGDIPSMEDCNRLVVFIREGYMETEDERMARLMKAHQESMAVKQKALLNSLYEMWDNDGSGMLDMEDVEAVMMKYKDGLEEEAINKAKEEYKHKSKHADNRLSKREFRDFVHHVLHFMAGEKESNFDFMVDFMLSSVERSYQERVRGEARKKWLQQIITAAETSGAHMEPVYKAVFQALYKDAENHGGSKKISSYVAMLETNHVAPHRGSYMLRYAAATPNDAEFLLGKCLFKDMKGISFATVDSGKPIHVPRVQNHGNIHFWNPERDQEKDGSFIVVPLKDKKKRVFGLLGIDTLCDPHSRALFITHEIQFYQGVAKAFSIAYHHVDVRQKTMRISESAISWIQRRCMHVHGIVVYLVEPDQKSQDFVLRKMLVTDDKGNAILLKTSLRLERKDNLFRDYLFKCVDNSESLTADAYGERHLAFPLRDDEGRAIVVVDISIGPELKQLPKTETKEVMKMLRLLQMAYKEISHEAKEGEQTVVLEGDKTEDDNRTEILFDRLMLVELRENVARLDATAYAELKSYKEPPSVIQNTVKSVLAVFYQDKAVKGELEDWNKCKMYLNPSLSQKILQYDPTITTDYSVPVELIHSYFDEIPHGEVSKHGSIPAQYLYNWVFVCVSLIEHTRKMDANKQQELVEQEMKSKENDDKEGPTEEKLEKEGSMKRTTPPPNQETAADPTLSTSPTAVLP